MITAEQLSRWEAMCGASNPQLERELHHAWLDAIARTERTVSTPSPVTLAQLDAWTARLEDADITVEVMCDEDDCTGSVDVDCADPEEVAAVAKEMRLVWTAAVRQEAGGAAA